MIIKLGKVISEYSVRNKADEDIPVYSVTNDKGFCTNYFSKDVSSKDRTTYKIVPYGYFAYNPSRINVGSVDWQHYEKKVIVSPLYVVFYVDEVIDQRYLLHYLKSDITLKFIKSNSAGSVRDNLKLSVLQEFSINLRTKEEQYKIVNILDKVDLLISLYAEKLKKFDDLTKSLFIEMFGDPVENPMNWDVKELGDYITVLTDFNSNGSYELLDSNVVMKDEPDYAWIVRITDLETMNEKGRKYIDEKTWNLLEKSKICGNEIIMCKIGSAGKIYIMPNTGKPASLGRNAFMFRFNELLEREYVYYLLNTDYGIKEITQYVRGAVTKTITKDDVRRLRVMVPPINEQKKFISFINKIDKSKLAVKKSLEELEILKKSLMQKYFA